MNLVLKRNHYIAATAGTALFAAVYECFSHQVYSLFMILAFLFPLLGGVLPYSLLLHMGKRRRPGVVSRCLYDSGIAMLTAGSLFQGILEIYGTTSYLSRFYWIAGVFFLLIALPVYLTERKEG